MSLSNNPTVSRVREKYPVKTCGCCFDENGLPYGFLNLSLSFAQRVANWRAGEQIRNYYWSSGMCLGKDDGETIVSFESRAKLERLWRFKGYADEIAPLNHRGWYNTEHSESSDVSRGVVVQLPARSGASCFLAGYEDSVGGSITIDPSESFDDEEEAARRADENARIAADRAREFYAKEEEEREREEREAGFEYA